MARRPGGARAGAPQAGADFPRTTLFDNVACQHRLLTEHLGVEHIALVFGEIDRLGAVPVRIHRENIIEDVFAHATASHGNTISRALKRFQSIALVERHFRCIRNGSWQRPPRQ